MSASETSRVIPNRESFTIGGMQQSPAPFQTPSSPVVQNMCLASNADGTVVSKPVPGSSPSYQSGGVVAGEGSAGGGPPAIVAHNLNVSEAMKRKRGRPRKYGPDGSMAMGLVPAAAAPQSTPSVNVTPPGGSFSPPAPPPSTGALPPPGTPPSPSSSMKKARGRPRGSSKKQRVEDWGPVDIGFTPHFIFVRAGEDVSTKIMSFSQHGPRAICIISANGMISNVTLRQAAASGGTATYEGHFEILCLSGSFLPSGVGGHRSRTGGLSVTLTGQDGQTLGGCVAGLLIAASPVQVVVVSFMPDVHNDSKSANHQEHFSAPMNVNPLSATGASSPPYRGTLSESSGVPGSPLNQSLGACNNVNSQGDANMPWK